MNTMQNFAVAAVKAVLCVWVGIFMLLPNCLCECLQPFGVEIFHQEPVDQQGAAAGHTDAPENLEFERTPPPTAPPIPCHCGEACNKVADGTDSDDKIDAAQAHRAPWSYSVANRPGKKLLPTGRHDAAPPRSRKLQAELCRFQV